MKTRFHTLDFLRGFAFINMFLFHGIYDLVFLFGISIPWYTSSPGYYWQQAIVISFIFLSGISSKLSNNILKRGLIIFGCAMVITLFSYLFDPRELVAFGVLHFVGAAYILLGFLRKWIDRIPKKAGFFIMILLFLIMKELPSHYLGFGDIRLFSLPAVLYQNDYLFWLGFPSPRFYSSDYVPILPSFFLFLSGYFSWIFLKSTNIKTFLSKWNVPVINWIGKHTLLLYMIHQPLIYSVLYLVFQFN